MTKTLKQMLKEVGPARRKKIETRAAQLVVEEMSLRELRRAHKLTQERIAESLGIGQDQVSRLEQRTDPFDFHAPQLCGSRGRRLIIIAEFPRHKPVAPSGIAALDADSIPATSRSRHAEASAD